MTAMPLVLGSLAVFALIYRFYYGFVAAKVAVINESRVTPAHTLFDKQNYYPMSKWVLFGHHFAAIAGAGPLVGPVIAAQFGYFPGFLWMVIGAALAGAMHDFILLVASVRHNGKSLAEIARAEINKISGITASVAVLIIVIIALAAMGLVVVNSLAESSWGTFTIACTIPIAFLMGLWMFKFRKGKTVEATIIGVSLLTAAVIFGKYIPGSAYESWFSFDHKTLTLMIAAYGLLASVLPVWLLLSPRDYLSSIMKIAVIGFLAIGVVIVNPTLNMPAFTDFTHGGGPVIPGTLFPYLFITIACGAISGFHALVSSGTTPKMLSSEKHLKFIGAGAMLTEGMVSVLALIAACSLQPMDYFLINVPAEKLPQYVNQLHSMGFTSSQINELSAEVGEKITGRTGGAVSLAVGMSKIFSSIPGLKSLMSYWYHFAIMFEALFVLTIIDAGTRIARFVLQEALGKVWKPFERTNWLPGNILTSLLVVFAWAYFIYTGSVTTIWPMLGAANQLLATIALAVGTSFIINRGRARYAWITLLPMVFVGFTTLYAGISNIFLIYIPQAMSSGNRVQGTINAVLTTIIIICVLIILSNAIPKWIKKPAELQVRPGDASY
jgi:carbon starvation protein